MPTPLKEQLLDLVVTKLQAIAIASGYEETVTVYRPSAPAAPLDFAAAQLPAIIVCEVEHRTRWHIRGAEECILMLDIKCCVSSPSAGAHDETLQDLIADVKKVVYANRLWNDGSANLAVRSWIEQDLAHEPEVSEAIGTGGVRVAIKYRADQANPFVTKAV